MLYTFSFCSCMHAAYSSLQSTFRFLLAVPAHRIEIRVYRLLQSLLFLVSLCSFRSCSVTVSPFDYCLLFLQFLVSLSVLLSSQYLQTHLISLFFFSSDLASHISFSLLCDAFFEILRFSLLALYFFTSLFSFSHACHISSFFPYDTLALHATFVVFALKQSRFFP